MKNSILTLSRCAELLRAGQPVAFPTETVYGLGANALDDKAVAAVFALKGRPSFNPLIVHVADVETAERYVHFTPRARLLAERFWPGPLTLVLKRKWTGGVSLLASAGLDTIGVRVPAHALAQTLLKEADIPIAAPSANRSGCISPTDPAHVREEFGDKVAVLEGGACEVGIESTVIDISGEAPVLLRPGAITREMLEDVLQEAVHSAGESSTLASPGMLESHYAPGLPVRLQARNVQPGEALLAFGPQPLEGAKRMLNLSASCDLQEAAANLFAYLRALDVPECEGIVVMPIPDTGLGVAINDRLKRAAAPRNA